MIRLLRMDAVALLRDWLAAGALAVGLLAALLAALAGHGWARQLEASAATSRQEAGAALVTARETWAKAGSFDPAEAVLVPGRLVTPLRFAAPLLPDFSMGRSPIEPVSASARLSSRPDALFARYEVENPERLARGGLDLAFVAVVLAPLLLIGLGFGVFAGDRDSGTARLWLAQAGSPLRLLAARSLNRLALVFVPILLAGIALGLLGPPGRGWAVLGWLGIALLGLLFWWAVILLVNSLRITAETAAFALVGLWTLLVFVLPVASAAAATLLNPPPSRFEQIAVARAAEIRASRDYDDDHPELSAQTVEGRRSSVVRGIEVRQAVAQAVTPLRAEQERQLAAQRSLGRALTFLSPPALAADALAAVSRTDAAFYEAQRGAVTGHLAPLGDALAEVALGRRSINAGSFDTLPRFEPPPAPATRPGPLVWLLAVTLVLAAWALARLRRANPL